MANNYGSPVPVRVVDEGGLPVVQVEDDSVGTPVVVVNTNGSIDNDSSRSFGSAIPVRLVEEGGVPVKNVNHSGSFSSLSIRNEISNSEFIGAANPSTMPTNMSISVAAGLTATITPTTSNGVPVLRIRVSGTATSGNNFIAFDTATSIEALQGQSWAQSFMYRLSNGALTNVSLLRHVISARNISGTAVEAYPSSNPNVPTGSFSETSYTATITHADTRFVRPLYFFTTAGAVDFTLDIMSPQLIRNI